MRPHDDSFLMEASIAASIPVNIFELVESADACSGRHLIESA